MSKNTDKLCNIPFVKSLFIRGGNKGQKRPLIRKLKMEEKEVKGNKKLYTDFQT